MDSRCPKLIHACLLLLAVALPFSAKAQFLYVTINGTITVTGYTGPGGAVIIPSTINGLPVTTIGSAAFLANTKMTSITIDDNVRSIGMAAFQHCSGLMLVTFGKDLTSIGNQAFDSCNNLTNVTINDGVTSIGENAFSGCSSLATIKVPVSITSLPDQAFQNCTNLTSITIGSSVTNLGNNAFENCTALKSIYFKGDAPSFKACVFCGDEVTVYYSPETGGWGSSFAGRPAVAWNLLAQINNASFGVQQNGFGFDITGMPDIPIVVEASTDLAARSWALLQSGTLTNGLIYFSDPKWKDYPHRFYRIRSP